MSGYCDDCGNTLCICNDTIIDKVKTILTIEFNATEKEIEHFLKTPNPMLGQARPMDLVLKGRGNKLLMLVEAMGSGY